MPIVAFGTSLDDGARWHVFLFGLQTPLVCWFLQVDRYNDSIPCRDGLIEEEVQRAEEGWRRHRFVPLCVSSTISGHHVSFPDAGSVVVVEDLMFVVGGGLVGCGLHCPLAEWEERWPLVQTDGSSRKTAVTKAQRLEAVESHGWAEEYLLPTAGARHRDAPAGRRHDERPARLSCDGVLAAAWQLFEESLTEDEDATAYDGDDFFIRLRASSRWSGVGGPSSDEGSVATEAKRGEPRRWCGIYGFRVSSSFPIASLTLDGAMALAQEWCRRLQYFYNMYRRADIDDYKYTLDDRASYAPHNDWRTFVLADAATAECRDRIALIESLVPMNP